MAKGAGMAAFDPIEAEMVVAWMLAAATNRNVYGWGLEGFLSDHVVLRARARFPYVAALVAEFGTTKAAK